VLLEAARLSVVAGASVLANGGAGGSADAAGGAGGTASSGARDGGDHGSNGGGGGGGSVGRTRLRGTLTCSIAGTYSPVASQSCP
jgi:hypothetical protein